VKESGELDKTTEERLKVQLKLDWNKAVIGENQFSKVELSENWNEY